MFFIRFPYALHLVILNTVQPYEEQVVHVSDGARQSTEFEAKKIFLEVHCCA